MWQHLPIRASTRFWISTARYSWSILKGGHWVRFVVTRVPVSLEKPHGLDYSLTLHGPDGDRLVGFDNAHPVSQAGVRRTSGPSTQTEDDQGLRIPRRSKSPGGFLERSRLRTARARCDHMKRSEDLGTSTYAEMKRAHARGGAWRASCSGRAACLVYVDRVLRKGFVCWQSGTASDYKRGNTGFDRGIGAAHGARE